MKLSLAIFFLNIWDAEMGLIEMINTIAKDLALIRIPSRNKLESKVSFDILEDKLQATLKLLLKTLEELYKKINKKDKLIMINETKISKIKDVILEFKGYIRRNMKKNQFSIICNEIIVSFKEFKVANSEIKNIKDTNTEIILECDSEKLKSFIDKYFNILYKYCEVMENIDETCLTLYCFYISESGYPCEKILEEFYTDKLVAKELKKYLLDFSEDMTDFMIFSQTDYFKNEFSARLLTNLDYVIEAYEQKDLLAKNLNVAYINLHLIDFYNIWSAILYDPYKETILTMEDLIKNMKDDKTELKVKVGSFLRKYLFIILLIILFSLSVLFIHLQRPSNSIN